MGIGDSGATVPAGAVKTDGRKRRWHQHKVERRNELIDGTIEAIRRRGQYVSMDEIAGESGSPRPSFTATSSTRTT